MSHINLVTAFAAGLVSFISPCVLPLVPAYLSFLTGTAVDDLKRAAPSTRGRDVVFHAVAFICGFTLVFVALGLLSSAAGGLLAANRIWLARIGGAFVILMGLNMLGVFRLPWFMMDKRLRFTPRKPSYAASAFTGVAFAAGWSPCIGPILSAILLIASREHFTTAGGYLLAYSSGLAVPFLAVSLAFNHSLTVMGRVKRFLPAIEATAGVFLIAVGAVLVTNSFLRVAGWFYAFVPVPKI